MCIREQRRVATERPKADCSIPRARSGPWRSGTGRRLTPAQPAGAPLANAIALTGSPRPTSSPSVLPLGGGGGPSYAARRALRRGCASRPTARFDLATSSAALWTHEGGVAHRNGRILVSGLWWVRWSRKSLGSTEFSQAVPLTRENPDAGPVSCASRWHTLLPWS